MGPPADWHVVSDGSRGYVVANDVWRVPRGPYSAKTLVATAVTLNFEVWDDNTDTLLARRQIFPSAGFQDVTLAFQVPSGRPPRPFSGAGLFHDLPIPPTPGARVELRVWTPGGGISTVYALDIQPLSGARS